MDDPSRHSISHRSFAGRLPAGTQHPVTLSKNGVRHVRRLPNGEENEVLSIGLACSECFSGPNLYKILKPGFDYEARAMLSMMSGEAAAPLSIHTSSGVTEFLDEFLEALEPHLPWNKNTTTSPQRNTRPFNEDDWCVSLQLEGASAVWAGVDMLLQARMFEDECDNDASEQPRTKVAVAGTSYHGPPSTSFGSKSPLWHKHHQLKYPAPRVDEELDEDALFEQFSAFLQQNGSEIGVILFEPQWGSSQAGMPWPKDLLKRYISLSKEYGIKVLCDEIMCGLGRHGHQTLFVSEAWDLDPDCVTFGKAIGAGVFPISGAIMKEGRVLMGQNKASVMQSHTYAGSSARALMAATEVLKELPKWFSSISKLGEEMEHIFRYLNKVTGGLVQCHGQGLMWGGSFSRSGQCEDPEFRNKVIAAFKKNCSQVGILPYYVPVGGFMVSPVVDVDVGTIYEIGTKLEEALSVTMSDVGWHVEKGVFAGELVEESEEFGSITDVSETESVSSMASADSSSSDSTRLASVTFTDTEAKAIGQLTAKYEKQCQGIFHKTKSCTTCSDFVCETIRTKFMEA